VDRKGFRVLAGIRTGVDAQRLRSRSSSRLTSIVIDVTSETSIGNAFSIVKARVGESGLAGLDNNAGSGIASPVECVRLPERLPAAGAGGMANQGLPVRAGLHLHAGRRGGGRPRGPDGEEAEDPPSRGGRGGSPRGARPVGSSETAGRVQGDQIGRAARASWKIMMVLSEIATDSSDDTGHPRYSTRISPGRWTRPHVLTVLVGIHTLSV